MASPSSGTVRTGHATPDLAIEASLFRDRLGWPVTLDVARHRLLMRTGDLFDALILPESMAESVAASLSSHLMTGPVYRDNQWWTFLTAPCPRRHLDLPTDLRTRRVHAVPAGGQLIVPPLTATASWWQHPEPDQPLPPWSAVVALTRSLCARTL